MPPLPTNSYSGNWFDFFHVGIDQTRTIRETEFVCRNGPLPQFRKVLDICCGMGRHARALSERGYQVTGVDRDAEAIAKAKGHGGNLTYVVADIRNYQPTVGTFDLAIVMGQSFGHFDDATNRKAFARLTRILRKGGRVILDLWNTEFFVARQGARELKTAKGAVRENKWIEGDRLFVDLRYPDQSEEQFEWQLFTPAQMTVLAASLGLALLIACTDFSETTAPSPNQPRIQFILERV